MKRCVIDNCEKPAVGRGMCHMHYKRWQRHGDPFATSVRKVCTIEGCAGKHFCKGFCQNHYRKWKRKLSS
ncbi:hypothetical protein WD019_18635 [Fictibacillus sp. Mic-4]|uniref:hypothetical protein n=1 Tax=Fictibacillus TaxID=1329200 RepID=UPI0004164ADA|nr:hypothetical protein [Fictibacillus gelatini]